MSIQIITQPRTETALNMTDIIDESLVLELVNLGAEIGQPLMQELLEKFKTDFPAHLHRLQVLAHENKFKELEYSAHALKGSAATLGAMRLRVTCELIEDQASQVQTVSVELLGKLQDDATEALATLEHFLLSAAVVQPAAA